MFFELCFIATVFGGNKSVSGRLSAGSLGRGTNSHNSILRKSLRTISFQVNSIHDITDLQLQIITDLLLEFKTSASKKKSDFVT